VLLSLTPKGKAYIDALMEASTKHLAQLLEGKKGEEIIEFAYNPEKVVTFLKSL